MGRWFFKRFFIKLRLLQQMFDDSSLQITLYNANGKRCVDDVRDGRHNLCIPNNVFTSVLTKAEVIPLLKIYSDMNYYCPIPILCIL